MKDTKELQTIIVSDKELKVLDQLKLPEFKEYIDVITLEDTFNVIKDMNVRGAPLIASVALQGLKINILKLKCEFKSISEAKEYLQKSTEYLISSRPTAVNLSNDLNLLLKEVESTKDIEELIKFVSDFANKNIDDYIQSSLDMSRIGADQVLKHFFANRDSSKKINILTICNTGKLAVTGVGTALGVIREIKNRGNLNKFYIPETRPYNQGSRLTAFEAVEDNLPGVLITDSTAAFLMQKGEIDCVIVGADRVVKSGATANKIGTYSLAVLAKFHNIPFYVVLPESTIDLSLKSGKEIKIEERPANELKRIKGIQLAPENISVWTPAFDVTPPDLITNIITEKGLFEYERINDSWEKYDLIKIPNLLLNQKLCNETDRIELTDVADGNLNLVYHIKVYRQNEESYYISYCLKQALPFIKCLGEAFPLSIDRSIFEAESLKYEYSITPNLVPKFYFSDETNAIIIMEFLENHIILRQGLINKVKYDNLELIGDFVAKCCFYTSGLHLSPKEYRKKLEFWNKNNGLCEITEKYFFSDPFISAEGNSYLQELKSTVEQIQKDLELLSIVIHHRDLFVEKKQALLHADLHSGSIMVNKETSSMKIIDSEFAFYGPISFDVGSLIGSYLISYFSQIDCEDNSNNDIELFKNYLLENIISFFNKFKTVFISLWNDKKLRYESYSGIYEHANSLLEVQQHKYFKEILAESIVFAGIEIIRRIIGVAKTKDFELIKDLKIKAECEKKALLFAIKIIKLAGSMNSIEDLISAL